MQTPAQGVTGSGLQRVTPERRETQLRMVASEKWESGTERAVGA